jgi:SAM-dependent methyltransferase
MSEEGSGGTGPRPAPSDPSELWALGDFRRISGSGVLMAELLCEAAEVRARERALDVACGNGNVALSAARRRAEVVGVDAVPLLIEHARRRAEIEGLRIEFREGNAEALPFPNGSFDVTLSAIGVAFASRAENAARELIRVTRPGGRIALANWTRRGFTGEALELVGTRLRAEGLAFDPLPWGESEFLGGLFGDRLRTVVDRTQVAHLRADSVASQVAGLERFLSPVVAAFGLLAPEERGELRERLAELVRRHNRAPDGTVLLESEYREWVAVVGARQSI